MCLDIQSRRKFANLKPNKIFRGYRKRKLSLNELNRHIQVQTRESLGLNKTLKGSGDK